MYVQNAWLYYVLDCNRNDYCIAADEEYIFMYLYHHYVDFSGIQYVLPPDEIIKYFDFFENNCCKREYYLIQYVLLWVNYPIPIRRCN